MSLMLIAELEAGHILLNDLKKTPHIIGIHSYKMSRNIHGERK